MLIKYNKSNVHALGHVPSSETKIAGGPQDIAWLRPGWNEFPSHIWEMYKTHPQILKMLEAKDIELMNIQVKLKQGKKMVTKVIGPGDSELHLMELPEPMAIKVASETLNRQMLERWADEETRHKVKRAIMKQIEPLMSSNQAASA